MQSTRKKLSAYAVYLLFSGASSFFFSLIVTVNLVYQVEVAKLNPLQLVLVGTALECVCFIAQIPTGILADVYSRRLSVILGVFITGAGFVLEGSIARFETILIAQALFGIGATFTDGAEQAWIADEVGEDRVGSVFMRSAQFGMLGGLLGSMVSVVLASIRLNLPLIIGGSLYILLAVFLLFFMPENGFRPTPKEERQSWRELGTTLRNGIRLVRLRHVLLTILFIELFYGLASEGWDRLSTAHFLADFTFPTLWQLKPVVWFGVFGVVSTLLSLLGTEIVRRSVNMNNQCIVVRALFIANALAVGCVLLFALAGTFWLAVTGYLAYGVIRGSSQPIYTTWLTRTIDAKVRATLISVSSQMNALGQIVGGPPVGYIGTVFSLRAALVAVSIILAPVLLLLAYTSRKLKAAESISDEEVTIIRTPEPV